MKKGNEMGDLRIAMSSSASTFDLLASSSFGQRSEMKGWFTMKKLMFAAAVAAGVVCGASAVESSIVGYNTVTLKPGWNMFAVNFKGVNDDQAIGINDLFPGGGKSDTKFTPGSGSDNADYIQVWDSTAGEYTTYLLYKKAKGTSEANYWWTDASGVVADKKFKNGDAFWFYKRGTVDVDATVSGEVFLDSVKTVEIKNGWNMIGSYFPAGWKLNDDYYTPTYWQNSGAVPGSGSDSADYIQVWDASANEYTTYLLYKKAKGTSTANYTWTDASGVTFTGDVLTSGKGAWYYHRGTGFNLEIKKQF